MRYLITGTAGFIGFHAARTLLSQGHEVTGIDGMIPYYDVSLKKARHDLLASFEGFSRHETLLEDSAALERIVAESRPEIVIHLAAQAGVRHSLKDPRSYIDSNLVGSFNILEQCRNVRPRHVLIASTSSVYGARRDYPFRETDNCDYPLTLYSASKKAVENIAHCYAHVWNVPITVARFFSAYGPWGRPDMAMFKFVENIFRGQPIDIYNHGDMERDWTYIDDLVEAVVRLTEKVPVAGESATGVRDTVSQVAPFRVVNIGGGQPTSLMRFIEEVERAVGKSALRNYLGMQLGDVERSEASTELLEALVGFRPSTPISKGVNSFVAWYREYYRV